MNHTRERHLYGTALLKEKGEGIHEGLGRPDLLITDTDRVQWKNVKRKERDVKLLGEFLDDCGIAVRTLTIEPSFSHDRAHYRHPPVAVLAPLPRRRLLTFDRAPHPP